MNKLSKERVFLTNTNRGFFLCLMLSLCFVFGGCSGLVQTDLQSSVSLPPESIQDLSLYMSRTNTNTTDFEQYKISEDGSVFVECGRLVGGRFTPAFQKLDQFKQENEGSLYEALSKLVASSNYKKQSFEKPGKNSSLFDPGVFQLSFNSHQKSGEQTVTTVDTSLNAIVEPTNTAEKQLQKIAEVVRSGVSFSEPLCGNKNFYGLAGR